MSLPKLLSAAEVAAYLEVSEDTLSRWRASGEGPASCKIGQRVAYTESAVAAYITAQETGSKASTPAALQAAITAGNKGMREALAQRTRELQQIDREDRESLDGVSPLTVGNVGEVAGIERHVFQNGQWVKNGVLSQSFEQPAAAPHILNNR